MKMVVHFDPWLICLVIFHAKTTWMVPCASQASFEPIAGKIQALNAKKSQKNDGEILENGVGTQLSGGDPGHFGQVFGHFLC